MFVNENGSSYIAATTRYGTSVENEPKPQEHAAVHTPKPAPSNDSGNAVVHLWHAAVAAAKTTASGFADGKNAAVEQFSQARSVIAEDFRKGDILHAVHDFQQGEWNIVKEAVPHVWGGITDANREFNNSVDQTSVAALDGATGFISRHLGDKAGNLFHDGGTLVGRTLTQQRDFNIGFAEGLVEGAGSMAAGIEKLSLGIDNVRLATYDYAMKGRDYREGVNAKFSNVAHNPGVIADGAGRATKGLGAAVVNFGKDTWHAAEDGDAEHFGRNTGRITFDVGSLFVVPGGAGLKAPKASTLIADAETPLAREAASWSEEGAEQAGKGVGRHADDGSPKPEATGSGEPPINRLRPPEEGPTLPFNSVNEIDRQFYRDKFTPVSAHTENDVKLLDFLEELNANIVNIIGEHIPPDVLANGPGLVHFISESDYLALTTHLKGTLESAAVTRGFDGSHKKLIMVKIESMSSSYVMDRVITHEYIHAYEHPIFAERIGKIEAPEPGSRFRFRKAAGTPLSEGIAEFVAFRALGREYFPDIIDYAVFTSTREANRGYLPYTTAAKASEKIFDHLGEDTFNKAVFAAEPNALDQFEEVVVDLTKRGWK